MSRKLASIQMIHDLREHPNADSLLIAKILGWDVVVSKNDGYKVGQNVVYFEVDSFLPCVEEYEFLRKSSYKNSPILGEGFRLKPIKLRGVISSGLIMPIEVCFKDCMPINEFNLGEDVTELLNIKKWEEPEVAQIGGDFVGKRQGWVEHSDETRIQSEPGLLDEFDDYEYYITTKYDGSSHYIAIDEDDVFHFGSHNYELKPIEKQGGFYNFIKDNELIRRLYKIKQLFEAKRVYVIGEWCGMGIQKNKLQLQKPYWYPFTVNVDGQRLGLDMMKDVVATLRLKMVEVEEIGKNLKSRYPTVDDLLERASENRMHVYPGECEGIVIRPVEPVYSEILGKDLSMKVINNKYLLKE